MRRKTKFDQTKLTQVATNKTVLGVYVDSFPIEMVKLRFAEFEGEKNSIDIYLSFEDALRITQDIKSGKFFKDLQNSQYPIYLSRGGTVKDGQAISRAITAGMKADKVYLNAQLGPGKVIDTGAILPDGQPTKKVSVGMSVDHLKGLFLYMESGINAYMPYLIKDLVKAAEENRQKYGE